MFIKTGAETSDQENGMEIKFCSFVPLSVKSKLLPVRYFVTREI